MKLNVINFVVEFGAGFDEGPPPYFPPDVHSPAGAAAAAAASVPGAASAPPPAGPNHQANLQGPGANSLPSAVQPGEILDMLALKVYFAIIQGNVQE